MKITSGTLKRFFSILLALLVFATTLVSVLAIWDVIDITDILSKSLSSLLIIFASSAITLFIFSVLYQDNNHNKYPGNYPPDPNNK
ncbi:MAG: hypothetical protein PHR79_07440 [Bacteroidales bacterium]|nr:hypothetical protein [Bacteroidales bacterium]